MRMMDWSSDVCSSELGQTHLHRTRPRIARPCTEQRPLRPRTGRPAGPRPATGTQAAQMSFHVRFTEEAQADIERLYDFPLDRDPPDFAAAERTLTAIAHAITLLEHSPWSCRKAHAGTPLLRELLIGFGQSGYVALFEIDDDRTVTVLAIRHQREDDYH